MAVLPSCSGQTIEIPFFGFSLSKLLAENKSFSSFEKRMAKRSLNRAVSFFISVAISFDSLILLLTFVAVYQKTETLRNSNNINFHNLT